ncbi:MAG: glycosyltransferase family 39 protein, partial [Candidatus Hydrogenedentes bacterium]|nr:glycosyltransferase family 39 protein [Candidatus Hydrogenedentota bacterium]
CALLWAGDGELSVTLFSWLVGVLACVVMFALGRRVGGRACGWIAAAIFATSPIFFDQVGVASIDVPFAALTVAALGCAMAWYDEKRFAYLVLAGFFAGSSCGIRHTGYLVCLFLAIGVVWVARDRRWISVATFGAVVGVAAAPWLIRSAVVSGNPVYPFLSGVFPSVALPDLQTTALSAHETVRGRGLLDLLMFPWRIVMQPEGFDGWSKSPGGLVLLLGLPGLIVGGGRARALGAYGIAGGVCFFFFQRLARYLLPFFMPMMVVASVAALKLPRLRRPVHALVAVSLLYGLMLGVAAVHFKVPVALGMESKTAYLSKRIERYPAFAWVNANLPEAAGIMTFDPRSYYINRPTFQNYAMLPVLDSMSATERGAWFAERRIEYLFYPTVFFSESPAYVTRGYTAIVDRWRADRTFLRLVKVIEVPRLRRDGVERVEVYRVRQASVGSEAIPVDVDVEVRKDVDR